MMRVLSVEWGMQQYGNLFKENGYPVQTINFKNDIEKVNWKDIDLVLFTGGEDVDPFMYSEPNAYASSNYPRDIMEEGIWALTRQHMIPCVGICRGSQFLTVMNGGRLVQDVRGHTGSHRMYTRDGSELMVSSTHHQMMIPEGTEHELIAWATHGRYKKDGYNNEVQQELDPEVVWYPHTRNLAVQYHPEYLDRDTLGYKYFFNLIKEFISND